MIFDDDTAAENADDTAADTAAEAQDDAAAESEDKVPEEAASDDAQDDDGDITFDLRDDGSVQMDLSVEITESGPCQRHVVVKVPRANIEAVHAVAVGELSGSAEVPGFRKGHVPAGLIAKRFRRELADEVKQKVLVGSLEQIAEEHDLEPINEPNLDVDMIEIPEDGDFEYEFDVEVRPDFDLPEYKGLTIDRPQSEVTDEDVNAYLDQFLQQYARFHDHDGPAEAGDTVIANLAFAHGDETIRTIEEAMLDLRPKLRFQDAELDGFDELMIGAAEGDQRTAEVTVAA